MNFKVSDDKSLKAALTASNNVQVARDALLKLEGNDTEISDAARTLCRATAVEADAQGFSYDDTGRIVWAYIKDLALPTSKRGLTESACGGMEFAWAPPPKTGSTESAGGGR